MFCDSGQLNDRGQLNTELLHENNEDLEQNLQDLIISFYISNTKSSQI